MSPSNTSSNALTSIGSSTNKTNATASTKNTDKTAPAFNALFGQAIEKKQGLQNLLSSKSATTGFGDEFRSDPQRTPERKANNKAKAEENRMPDSIAQSLAAQQMVSTNTWAQTQSAPKANDQEWQAKANASNAFNASSKAMQNQSASAQDANPSTDSRANGNANSSQGNEQSTLDAKTQADATTNSPPSRAQSQSQGNALPNQAIDETAERINQITQAVLQSSDGLNASLPAGNPPPLELKTLPVAEASQTSTNTASTAAMLGAEGLQSAPSLEGSPSGQNAAQGPNTSPLQNTAVAVQQVMAQREALNSVNGNTENTPDIGFDPKVNSAAGSKAASLDPSLGSNTSNPLAGIAPNGSTNGSANSTPSISTRLGTPINQPGFAKELGHTVQWAIGKNISTVDIRINPESFGPLNMRIVQKGQDIQLIIRTQDEQSASMLQQAVAGLKESLGNQGLQLNQVNIQHGQSNTQAQTGSGSGSSSDTSGNPNFSQQPKPNAQSSTGNAPQDEANTPASPSTNSRAGVGGVDMFA